MKFITVSVFMFFMIVGSMSSASAQNIELNFGDITSMEIDLNAVDKGETLKVKFKGMLMEGMGIVDVKIKGRGLLTATDLVVTEGEPTFLGQRTVDMEFTLTVGNTPGLILGEFLNISSDVQIGGIGLSIDIPIFGFINF